MTIPDFTAPLIGHASQERYFLDAWTRETMPHSLLFSGAKGVGKATFAYRLAAFILSGGEGNDALFGPSDLSVPPESPIVKRMVAGSHGDFLAITPDTSTATAAIKVDAIRKIGDFLSLTPSEAKWRVVLIDSADDMNPNAANALLKLLEEPPSHAAIILISHNPGKLLPTIRSRCRTIAFKSIDPEGFSIVLDRAGSKPSSGSEALHALAYGSPGMALTLEQYDAPGLYEQLLKVLAHYPKTDDAALAQLVKTVAGAKDKELWNVWRHVWECLMYRLAQFQQDIPLQPISDQESATLTRLASLAEPDHWQSLHDQASRWFRDTEVLHLDRKQVIHSLVAAASAA